MSDRDPIDPPENTSPGADMADPTADTEAKAIDPPENTNNAIDPPENTKAATVE